MYLTLLFRSPVHGIYGFGRAGGDAVVEDRCEKNYVKLVPKRETVDLTWVSGWWDAVGLG